MVSISVIVPTIPPRWESRERVLAEVHAQTRQADEVIVVTDFKGDGAAVSRNIGLNSAAGDYVAFFDDDDRMYPRHLQRLEHTLLETGADLIYPWHDLVPSIPNPLGDRLGMPFGRTEKESILHGVNFIPIAVLVRKELLVEVGGFTDFKLTRWDHTKCEVLDAWQKLLKAGARFAHCPYATWAAVRNGENTAGLSWPTHIGTKQTGYD